MSMSIEMIELNNDLYANLDKVRTIVGNEDTFHTVFGADCFLKQFPTLFTTGVQVCKLSNGFNYTVRDNKVVHDSSFFSDEEIDKCFLK